MNQSSTLASYAYILFSFVAIHEARLNFHPTNILNIANWINVFIFLRQHFQQHRMPPNQVDLAHFSGQTGLVHGAQLIEQGAQKQKGRKQKGRVRIKFCLVITTLLCRRFQIPRRF